MHALIASDYIQSKLHALIASDYIQSKYQFKDVVQRIKGFICIMLCDGNGNESCINTRIRICNELRQKSSLCLRPNLDSVGQAFQRVHLQSSTWLQCTSRTIINLSLQNNGWK